ncbi:MAG: hypothetical protein EPO32_05010 [Anaerolineae bacterium]|nr:MAG: hypothetical protein EPO32_05010 [Anaerolineae bacterium]
MDPKNKKSTGKSKSTSSTPADEHEDAKAMLAAKHATEAKEAADLQARQEAAMADMKNKFAANREAMKGPEIIDTVKLDYETTLSHLALKYYGHATPKYYNYIWEHNKDLLGDSANNSRPGMMIKIPKLPPDFDKQ